MHNTTMFVNFTPFDIDDFFRESLYIYVSPNPDTLKTSWEFKTNVLVNFDDNPWKRCSAE